MPGEAGSTGLPPFYLKYDINFHSQNVKKFKISDQLSMITFSGNVLAISKS